MNTPTNLVLLTFGDRLETHYQAALSILTFLNDPHIHKVIVVTDHRDFYQCFGNHIEFITIDEETLTNWQGELQFFWRIKIKALQAVVEHFGDQHILYVDSDTVLGAPLAPLIKGLNRQQPFMHIFEERLSEGSSKTVRNMWKCLKNRTFAGVTINASTAMWNAGVIALPCETAHEILTLALTICDEICATDCPRRLVEQFAFSLALNHYQPLQGCEHIIAHYWGNKLQWNTLAQELLLTAFLRHESLEQMKAHAAKLPIGEVPIFIKTSSTEKRLTRLMKRLFKRNQQRYFNSQE